MGFKVILLGLFAPFILLAYIFSDCPPQGIGTAKQKAQNILKNRKMPGDTKPIKISIDTMLAIHSSLSNDFFVEIGGIVNEVKMGGPESCNCKTDNKNHWDFHIEIQGRTTQTKDRIIAEITPNSREANPLLTYEYCKSLQGKRVSVTGYLFYDKAHENLSYNLHWENKHCWRGSAWEIHPVKSIIAF